MSFDGDNNNYLVAAATATTITLAAPGLRQALADNTAITAGGAYTANMAFDRNAFLLASRTPAMPQGGDTADDVMNVTDPVTELFEFKDDGKLSYFAVSAVPAGETDGWLQLNLQIPYRAL